MAFAPYVLLTLVLALAIPCIFYPTKTLHWLRLKYYRYDVTTALYMCNPTEKFIFNSILFLTVSLIAIATYLYLPNHIRVISRRAVYYYSGSVVDVAATNGRDFLLAFAGIGPNTTSANFVAGAWRKSQAVVSAATAAAAAAASSSVAASDSIAAASAEAVQTVEVVRQAVESVVAN